MRKNLLLLLFFLYSYSAQAQVGVGIIKPDSSAILHLESKNKGLLPPRMTRGQRDSIALPKAGLMVYNINDSLYNYYNGACWMRLYQRNCNDCYFDFTADKYQANMDRVVSDSVEITFTLQQTNGTPKKIALNVLSLLPKDMSITFDNNPVNSNGTSKAKIKVTPFTPDGKFAIVFQAICDNEIKNIVFSLSIEPCYTVYTSNSGTNYIMSGDLAIQHPTLNLNKPNCIINEIQNGVTLTGNTINDNAYSTGTIFPGSLLYIINNGNIIGKGGNGGAAASPLNGLSGNGQKGGNAMNITERATIINNGNIFGGGGGGNAMAFSITQNVGPITLGALIGAGGGGGAGGGLGGNIPAVTGLTFYNRGQNGTSGLLGLPGNGGSLNSPINFAISVVNITLTPTATGGNGGAYGAPGTQGTFALLLSATIQVPIIGTVPLINNQNIPIPIPSPAAGSAGYAIKRNGKPINIKDNLYNNSNLKGTVGN